MNGRQLNPCLATVAVVASAIAVAGGAAHAQFLSDPATNIFVGTRPSGVAAGDFDGDGRLDIHGDTRDGRANRIAWNR